MTAIKLSAHHDRKMLGEVYARTGRIHIPDFLESESADYLFRALRDETPWSVMYLKEGKGDAMPSEEWRGLNDETRGKLLNYVRATASHGFQFFYGGCLIHDE